MKFVQSRDRTVLGSTFCLLSPSLSLYIYTNIKGGPSYLGTVMCKIKNLHLVEPNNMSRLIGLKQEQVTC